MKFDKLSLFADGLTVPTTANNTTYSKVIDLRKCGQVGIDGMLRIWGGIVGTANATGSVTTKLQTSDGDGSFTDLVSEVQSGNALIGMFLPCKGLKRFIRLAFAVGGTQLGSAVTVKAGLVDQFEIDDLPAIQTYPPLEDLTGLADRMATELAVAATTKTITKGDDEDIGITAGVVASYTAPAKYTITLSADKVNIALANDAASGNVVLVDGLGKTKTIAVTAGT